MATYEGVKNALFLGLVFGLVVGMTVLQTTVLALIKIVTLVAQLVKVIFNAIKTGPSRVFHEAYLDAVRLHHSIQPGSLMLLHHSVNLALAEARITVCEAYIEDLKSTIEGLTSAILISMKHQVMLRDLTQR